MRSRITIVAALLAIGGPRLAAQQSDSAAVVAYRAQRAEALREMAQDEQRLTALRQQRLALESRLDSAAAHGSEARASTLLLSGDVAALRALDSLLSASEEALVADRDRFRALSDAVRRRAAGTLVVLIRADSGTTPAGAVLDSVRVMVDSAPAAARGYSALANAALAAGAVNEVFRSNVLPGAHVVQVSTATRAGAVTQAAEVDVRTGVATYVQFAWRNGGWIETTWTTGSAPTP
jgi:hypothetical protein